MTLGKKKSIIQKELSHPLPNTAIKNLASSIYQTLKSEGCKHKDIIGVSSQLLELVTVSIKKGS